VFNFQGALLEGSYTKKIGSVSTFSAKVRKIILYAMICGRSNKQEEKYIMVYTKQEKQEIERVLAVFAKYLNQRNHCDIAWSNKLGYLLLDYHTCIDTYLMRDATEAGGITDAVRFRKFLVGCASLVSEQVNYSTLAESADIAPSTAKEWLNVLVGLRIIYLLAPYSNNELKRLSKTPKLYFCDTGLCAYLSMWLTPDTLRSGAASGHYYENYVVMELVKNYAYAKSKVNLTYFRDSNAKEIDVFVEENNVIHPLEIKKSAAPDRREVKKYSVIDKASLKRGNGGIICMCEEPIPIDADNCFIPSNLI